MIKIFSTNLDSRHLDLDCHHTNNRLLGTLLLDGTFQWIHISHLKERCRAKSCPTSGMYFLHCWHTNIVPLSMVFLKSNYYWLTLNPILRLRFEVLRLRKMLLPEQSIFIAPLLSHLTHTQLLGVSLPVNSKQGLLSSQHQSPSFSSICLPLLSHLQTGWIRMNEEVIE